ncbi:hypothetical protein RSAG8_02931, partial [Rhizoctonia solani AG-8 WAC10335]
MTSNVHTQCLIDSSGSYRSMQ